MGKPDALSRRADHRSGQGDNNNLTLLAPEQFRIHVLTGTRFEGEERNILHEVWHSLGTECKRKWWQKQPGSSKRTKAEAR
jgi:hypothetical protein